VAGILALLIPLTAIAAAFIILPWMVLHYTAQWKKAASLTVEDENLLDDLYETARRLEARLETVERIVAADQPDFRPGRGA
jgi:phage shock protein B